ncbi:MAG: hypothetical protein ACK5ME_04300 [Parahaliea sp.]
MKHFKYWSREIRRIHIGSQPQELNLLCGSNVSKEDASAQITLLAREIEQRILRGEQKEEYDAAIREHIAELIDEHNVITVCRYGARIWNTTQYTVLDIDYSSLTFFDFFRAIRKLGRKERIVARFEKNIKKYSELGSDFRIYETQKGVRVIGRKYIDPDSKNYEALMKSLNVDWLYIMLSKKQKCYRARLTPKPYRMRFRTIRIKSPLDCEEPSYEQWSKDYDKRSEDFSVVSLIKIIGNDFSKEKLIQKHDCACNMQAKKRLA